MTTMNLVLHERTVVLGALMTMTTEVTGEEVEPPITMTTTIDRPTEAEEDDGIGRASGEAARVPPRAATLAIQTRMSRRRKR
jgi:hypothetical protein